MTFSWTDIEEIAINLTEQQPEIDPTAVRFTQLREMVEELEGFEPLPGQRVNEQILEAIQSAWIEEREDLAGEEDDGPGYTPNNPFR